MDATQFIEKALNEHGDAVYRVALHLMGNAADADDVSQDVFLRLYEHGPNFTNEDHLRAWLIKVCVNRCREILRSGWSKKVESTNFALEPAAGDSTEDEAIARLGNNSVWQALKKLPEDYREAISLFYLMGLNSKLCASLLGLKDASFRTRLFRARSRMKDYLEGVEYD